VTTPVLTTTPSAAPVVVRSRRRRWLRRAVLVALALAAIFALWVGSVAAQVWWVARSDQRTHVDAIVVLGASQYNGTPSPVLAWRLTHAKTLYKDGVAAVVVTVGGKMPGDQYTEGGSGRDYLAQNGVPRSALIAVPTGRDTWNSMEAVAALAKTRGWDSIVIVTDPWHAFRCREMAQSLGLTATTSPVHSGPVVQSRGEEARYIARETAAYVWWRLTGGRALPFSGPDAA
jgi:uncharacterized SAM-binding protein YcdF (DUF218 family)